jgi:hypothetical protein
MIAEYSKRCPLITSLKRHYEGTPFRVFCNHLRSKYLQEETEKDVRVLFICFVYRLLKKLAVDIDEDRLYEMFLDELKWTDNGEGRRTIS